MFDIKKVQQEAEKEIKVEREENAKKQIIKKLRQIEDAKVVLSNLEREYEDLLNELSQGN